MISSLSNDELNDIKKAWQLALGFLDLPLKEVGEIDTNQLFTSLINKLEKAKPLPRAECPNEMVNLLGLL